MAQELRKCFCVLDMAYIAEESFEVGAVNFEVI